MVTDIAQILQEKAGLSPDQSHEVANAVLDCVKSKVPSEFQSFLTPVFGGTQSTPDGQPVPAAGGELGSLLGAASGFFEHKG